jgi:adenylate cyclase class 2
VRSDAGRFTLLTLKGAPVDAGSGSRIEIETAVADAAAVRALLVGLGYEPWAAFTKQCTNHRFTRDGLAILATLVTVPTVDGTFLEVETIVPPSTPTRLGRTLRTIRSVLRETMSSSATHPARSTTR